MTHSASLPNLGSEFDSFLHATIGNDGNGMLLSVLSALARLGVDPWQEAASLASLSGPSAIARLTSLITALPDEPSSHRDHESIATRLVTLLPHGAGSGGPKSALPGSGTAFDPHAVLRMIVINILFVAFMVGAQWFAAGHQAPAPASDNIASTAQATTPTPPSPEFGQ
jgi:hypothetical protein